MAKTKNLAVLFMILIMGFAAFSVTAQEPSSAASAGITGAESVSEVELEAELEEEAELADDNVVEAESDKVLQEELSGDAGITPDSPVWGLERAMENINLALTFGEEAKARKRLELARERIIEAKVMAERNKVEALQKAKEAHQKHLLELRINLEKLKKDNPRDEMKINAEIEQKLEGQETASAALAAKIELKLRGNLTEAQMQKLTALIESLKNESAKAKLELRSEKAKAKVRLRAKESLTEEQADEIEEEIEMETEAEKRGKGEEVVATQFVRIAEKAVSQAKEKIAKIENEEIKTKAEFRLSNATSLLEQAKTALEKKNYAEARMLALQARKEAHNSLIMSSGKNINAEERQKVKEEIKEKAKERLEKAREMRKENIEQKREEIKKELEKRREAAKSKIEERKEEAKEKIEERKETAKERIEERKEAVKDKVKERNNTGVSEKTGEEIKEIKLVIGHTEYKPNEIKVKKGDKVTIKAAASKGTGTHNHGIAIDAYDINRAVTTEDSDSPEVIEFTADKEGTFEIYCKTCWDGPFGRGHPDIKAKLIVSNG